ncbi:hypothetical protein QLX08_007947 [Tetragonisca angustula]|uniref:Uncharacterized protein n=1 Tax=Tetragonisca angustula TaxID=166442 RepID=A0AAW0ZMK9_9HYME
MHVDPVGQFAQSLRKKRNPGALLSSRYRLQAPQQVLSPMPLAFPPQRSTSTCLAVPLYPPPPRCASQLCRARILTGIASRICYIRERERERERDREGLPGFLWELACFVPSGEKSKATVRRLLARLSPLIAKRKLYPVTLGLRITPSRPIVVYDNHQPRVDEGNFISPSLSKIYHTGRTTARRLYAYA